MWDTLAWVVQKPSKLNSAGVQVGGWKKSEWEMAMTGRSGKGPQAWREGGTARWTEVRGEGLKWLDEYEKDGLWDRKGKKVAAEE